MNEDDVFAFAIWLDKYFGGDTGMDKDDWIDLAQQYIDEAGKP